jgi:chromosome segregation ATPase
MSRVSTSITSFSADDTVFVDAHKGKGNKGTHSCRARFTNGADLGSLDPFACEPWSTFRSEMFASFETRHEQYRIAHEAQLSDFESRLTAALNTAFAQQNKSIDERFKQMDQKMDERFKAMDERMDERFDEMDKRMDERFDQMDKRISRLNRDLGEVIYKGNNLVRSTRDLVDWTEKLDMTVRSLVKTVDRHTVDLKDIRERLDSIVRCALRLLICPCKR